jgi:hypothetical protein
LNWVPAFNKHQNRDNRPPLLKPAGLRLAIGL